MKIFNVKYALSKGIIEQEALMIDEDRFVIGVLYEGSNMQQLLFKDDWFKSKSDALAKANFMRTVKIASLRKQIAKLESLRFD